MTHPYASFLVSGGAFDSTRVELVSADTNRPVYSISGADQRTLRPAVVDLSAHLGKDIFVRLVDDEAGAPTAAYIRENPWAHINFDHFRFHESKPVFVNEITPADITTMPPVDPVTHAGLSPRAAARAMTVPKGFSVTLAASEPDVVRPIAFAYDDRGRLWVAEAHTYPVRAPEGQGRDRILIFEDTNGDGRLDRRKIFMENLNLLSAIEVGFGGVWVGAAPHLLFIPVVEGEDRPAGPPQVMLDGWGYDDTHEVLNTFTWGPDGWLYGAHGVFTHSNVGKPGATAAERQRLNAGIWRFHPTKHVFEVFAEGTSNPWGLDFNDYGHAFTTVCVIEHLFHVVQGARYKRQAGTHFNPYIYDDVKTIADHVHWVGKRGPHAGNGRSAAAGGGHAHVGAMIYLGGDDWPAEYRDSIFMNNIHGARTNTDRLQRTGSGYSATHGPDFLLANDSWSQMLNFRYGPDGSVHVIDWYDKNQCHSTNPDIHQKTLGRIFKISHQKDRWPTRVNLGELSSEQLVALQLHRNDWYVRHARRILQERGPDAKVHAGLKRILHGQSRCDAQAAGALGAARDSRTHRERPAGAPRPWQRIPPQLGRLPPRRRQESVRCGAARIRADGTNWTRRPWCGCTSRARCSAYPSKSAGTCWRDCSRNADDATDQNLPLMVWYAAEPVVALDMSRALGAAFDSKLPRLFAFTVQRIAAIGTQEALRVLTDRLGRTEDAAQQKELLSGISKIVNKG